MQLVLSNNRILAHGENFLAMGGVVINTETGAKYENATIAECSGCPSDIGVVGYEYHAGRFVPCAPFGVGKGNIAVYCDDCKTPRDSGVSIDKVCAVSSYLAFVGNINEDMVAAAFGKNNEDNIKGVGTALVLYSNYKGEELEFKFLFDCNTLQDIQKSPNALAEVLKSSAIVELMRANEYSKSFIELWRLNDALPEQYRRDNFAEIVQDVEVMGYMYDNYETFEALGILSYSGFTDMAKQYAETTNVVQVIQYKSPVELLYNKKCFVIDFITENATDKIHSYAYMNLKYRPDGESEIKKFAIRCSIKGEQQITSVNKFASTLNAYHTIETDGWDNTNTGEKYNCSALVIPCE